MLLQLRGQWRRSPRARRGGQGLQLHLLVLAEERAVLHLLRRRLQDRAQGLGQAEGRGLLGWWWSLLVGKGQLLTWLRVALCYLHLIKICLELRLLLEKESLLLEPKLVIPKESILKPSQVMVILMKIQYQALASGPHLSLSHVRKTNCK